MHPSSLTSWQICCLDCPTESDITDSSLPRQFPMYLWDPRSPECQHSLNNFMQICTTLGVPLASEKIEGPSTSLTFLGITLDTAHMEISLPQDKLLRIRDTFKVAKENSYKREILSLVGLLQHATRVMRCGHTFVARMYATAAKVKQLHFFTTLNKEFQSDIAWWHAFIQCWVYSTTSSLIHTDLLYHPHRRLWLLELWCLHEWTMASVGMAQRVSSWLKNLCHSA